MYLPLIRKMDRAAVTALYEPLPDKNKEECGGIRVYHSYEAFLSAPVDCIIIAVPNYLHQELSVRALKAGKHVLCEKPVVLSEQEFRTVSAASEKYQNIFMPGFVSRFREDMRLLLQWASEERLGKIQSIQAGWVRRSGIPRPGSWFTIKQMAGGGVLSDLGPHVLDICLMIAGETLLDHTFDPHFLYGAAGDQRGASWFENRNTAAEAAMDVESTAIIKAHGKQPSLDVLLSWDAPVKGDCTYFYIQGEKGTVKCKTLFGYSLNSRGAVPNIVREEQKKELERMPLPYGKAVMDRAFSDMLHCFFDKTEGRAREEAGCLDALYNVKLIERIYKSERVRKE